MTTHDQPWSQWLLYTANLMPGHEQFYEYEEWGDDEWTFRLASRYDRMNVLVKFVSTDVVPPP